MGQDWVSFSTLPNIPPPLTRAKIVQHKDVLGRSIEKVGSQFKVTIFCPGFSEGAGDPLPNAEPLSPEEQAEEDFRVDNSKDTPATPLPKQATWKATTIASNSPHLQGVDTKGCLAMLITRPAQGAPDHDFVPVVFDSYDDTHMTSDRPDELNTVSVLGDPGLKNEKKRVAAVCLLRQEAPVWPAVAKHNAALKPVLNEILVGNGVRFAPRHDNIDSAHPIGQLPTINILDLGADPRVVELCKAKLDKDDRHPFSTYFSQLSLGVAVVSAPGGSGKSRLSSIVATLLGYSPSIRKVIVSAPSNGACSNIEERITTMASQMGSELVAVGHQSRNLMCLRGYAIDREAQKCLDILRGNGYIEDDELNPCPWKFHHSLCWWTLLALGVPMADVQPLNVECDNQELCDLHLRLNALLEAPAPTAEEESDEEENTETKRAPKAIPFEAFSDLVKIARRTLTFSEYAEQQTVLKRKLTLRKDIVRLMTLVVTCSNFVVVTPSMAANKPYKKYNYGHAKAIILDEAAAMHRTDGLIIYGNTPRPMIIVGDEKQLAPTLMTANQKDGEGNDINRFSDDAKISFLSWWLHLGFPAFHLYKQYRMARGMFDLSLELVYHNLKDEFQYAESCALTNFTYAGDIRAYLQQSAQLVMPDDTMAPIFVNCRNCPSRVDSVSKSRYNARAIECMVKWLQTFIGEVGVPADRIAAITPYRANLRHIRSRLNAEPILQGIEVSTIDSFQGREADIILLCLAVDKESGPGFTAHPQRLNVAITRHKTALFVFGDIDTIPAPDPDRPKRPRTEDAMAEDGAPVKVNATMMTKMFQWFRDNNMIMHLEGDPTVDPDPETAEYDIPAAFGGGDTWTPSAPTGESDTWAPSAPTGGAYDTAVQW